MAAHPATAFMPGETVNIPKYGGRAVILEGPADAPGTDKHGRYRVQYQEDGTCYWVNPSKIKRINLATKRIVVAYRTAQYRQAAIHNTDFNDVCLEIGCHAGVTSSLLSKRCQGVVGIDTSAHVINVARSKYPHLRFEQLDGNDVEGAQKLAVQAGLLPFNKLLVDISGQAPLSLLLPLLKHWSDAVPGITIIVKNRALHCAVRMAERLKRQQLREGSHKPATNSHTQIESAVHTTDHRMQQACFAAHPLMPLDTVPESLSTTQVVAGGRNKNEAGVTVALGNSIVGMELNSDTENDVPDIDYDAADCLHSMDQAADLFLGDGSAPLDPELKELFMWVCDQCEIFVDTAQQEFDEQYNTKALRRAAFVAQEISGKQARLLAKRERRAVKKLQAVPANILQ